jgi:hypothetical protein
LQKEKNNGDFLPFCKGNLRAMRFPSFWKMWIRVARFSLVHGTETGKMYQINTRYIPNGHKIHQMVIKYTKCPLIIPNGHKMYHHFPIYGPLKFTQIGIFGLKINHLATLLWMKAFFV